MTKKVSFKNQPAVCVDAVNEEVSHILILAPQQRCNETSAYVERNSILSWPTLLRHL